MATNPLVQLHGRLEALSLRGFDECEPRRDGCIRVRCSQCEALVINNVATHEAGRPNARYEDDEREEE